MNRQFQRPRLQISHGPKKKVEYEQPPNLGCLSPDLQPCSPPTFCHEPEEGALHEKFTHIGKYVVHQVNSSQDTCTAVNIVTGDEFRCKVLPLSSYRQELSPYLAIDGHPHVVGIWEIILDQSHAYVFFQRGFGDLHSYVREKKRLRQEEARELARQVVDAVQHCHESGLVLRDLKLRKFVFKNAERTELRLDGLEDAVVLDDDDQRADTLTDKYGCPAYVSPEILCARAGGYSGRRADLWSLGVMIYTMLVGRYPFHDRDPVMLFGKIRRGAYKIPDSVPARARCLIKNLLCQNPLERLSAEEVLEHPWFSRPLLHEPATRPSHSAKSSCDQMVPLFDCPASGAYPSSTKVSDEFLFDLSN
ncbi:tribbles-like protein 2 [Plakobranchus ocellatus]|uniref:Tribbles-like protein 2 n=1 Tax=Plakobranchus ocellatus TaxID=259542 RepID=A0AAV4A4R9_9GAST|nr:tribbles-like protein 2 [Plakobranchus ocellatus]